MISGDDTRSVPNISVENRASWKNQINHHYQHLPQRSSHETFPRDGSERRFLIKMSTGEILEQFEGVNKPQNPLGFICEP